MTSEVWNISTWESLTHSEVFAFTYGEWHQGQETKTASHHSWISSGLEK